MDLSSVLELVERLDFPTTPVGEGYFRLGERLTEVAGQLTAVDQKRLAYRLVVTRHGAYAAAEAARQTLWQTPWELEELERLLEVAGDGDDGVEGQHGLWDYPYWGATPDIRSSSKYWITSCETHTATHTSSSRGPCRKH